MRLKALAHYIQMHLHADLIAEAEAEAPEGGRPRSVDADVPTLEWCARIAKKNGRAAKDKIGKHDGLKGELLELVKKDPDDKDKKPKKANP